MKKYGKVNLDGECRIRDSARNGGSAVNTSEKYYVSQRSIIYLREVLYSVYIRIKKQYLREALYISEKQ